MKPLISALEDRFDVVILDSAPLLVKSDFLILASYVDGTLMLLESGSTTRKNVHELIDTLERASIKPIGFILNKLSPDKDRYYYNRYYRRSYDDSHIKPSKARKTRSIWSGAIGRRTASETGKTPRRKGGKK
jgi:Mrp family chromosome partitioning ATPase